MWCFGWMYCIKCPACCHLQAVCYAPTPLGSAFPRGMFGAVQDGQEEAVRFFEAWKAEVEFLLNFLKKTVLTCVWWNPISSKRLRWHTCVKNVFFPGDKGGACWQAAGVAGETRLGAPLPGGTFTFTLPGETFTLPGKRPSSKSLRFYPKLVCDGIQDLIQNIFVIRLKFAVPWHSSTWGSLPQCEWHPNDAKKHQVSSSKREYGKQSKLLNAHFWLQLLPGGEDFSLAIHRCWQSTIYVYMDGCSTVVLKWDMGMGIKWISGRGEVQSTLRC